MMIFFLPLHVTFLLTLLRNGLAQKPNVVVVMTDEHNLRTISCYRDHLLSKYKNKALVDVWGKDIFVETPNIDKLASQGAMFTNWYTASPSCTPSRASFLSGMFPHKTGALFNNDAIDPHVKTWADALQQQGYNTAYFGKYHLDGIEKPGFWKNVDNSQQRKAGFQNNKYRYNRGHWKLFDETDDGTVNVYDFGDKGTQKLERKLDKHYATDFIVDRGIDFIQEHAQAEEPFALFLSIPDPHSPMAVREPYNLLYNTTDFDPVIPRTTKKMIQADPSPPSFYQQPRQKDKKLKIMSRSVWKNKGEQEFRELLKEFKDVHNFDEHLRQYFGMVKLLDDKIGDLLSKVKELNIEENSIIVFTSDHGKLLFEHGKSNKGEPFFTSAGVPMLVKWPQKIKKGKIVETAYSSIDFAPTLLGLLNITDLPDGMNMHGVDGSNEILNNLDISSDDSKIVFSYRSSGRWIAAIKDGYKLVLNKKYKSDGPYLFDLNIDPDELMNFANSLAHKQIFEELKKALIEWIYEYEFLDADKINLYLDTPSCIDSKNVFHYEGTLNHLPDLIFCSDIGSNRISKEICLVEEIRNHCPVTCQSRCPDSDGTMMFRNKVVQCKELRNGCYDERVRNFCPRTCSRDKCRDDLEFKFFVKENMKRRCEFILTNNKLVAALRRKRFCADEKIASKCRWSCGGCNNSIFDDDSFTFGGTGASSSNSAGQELVRGYSYNMNCSWLTSNIKRRATRQKRFCPRVKSNCALSCGNY